MINKLISVQAILLILLIGAFVVRLYKFEGPIADWHSWRQADTASVTRNFVENGFDLLHPKFDDLSNVPSGIDNPNGYRFVEFPLYNATAASLFLLFDTFTIEQWGRLVTIFSSLASILLLFLIVKRYADEVSGLFVAFFASFLPFGIYYGRTILPDTSMIAATLASIYFFSRAVEDKTRASLFTIPFLLALFFAVCALLLKPFAAFFLLPIAFIAYKRFGVHMFQKWQLYVFAILSILLLILWRLWMAQYPEGIPVNDWLFNEGNIRFKGAFFYWIFAERIGKLMLGFWGSGFLLLGILWVCQKEMIGKRLRSKSAVLLSFLLSSLLYITIIARGNVQHDYYQILVFPSVALFTGLGSRALLSSMFALHTYVKVTLLIVWTGFTIFFSWYFIRDYYNINNPSIIAAGEAVAVLTPEDAKVIALYDGDTSFLYQTKRKGWASFEKPLDVMIRELGADYLVIANPTEQDLGFSEDYPILVQTDQYVLFQLHSL